MKLNKSLTADHEINFVALTGGESGEVKGTVTMPSLRLIDPNFIYRPSCSTDLAETFRRARAHIGE